MNGMIWMPLLVWCGYSGLGAGFRQMWNFVVMYDKFTNDFFGFRGNSSCIGDEIHEGCCSVPFTVQLFVDFLVSLS
jgi:hypothetical protein